MYAVVRTGSKQYRVTTNDVIKVEKLPVEKGASIELTDVLAVDAGTGLVLGNPVVAGAAVVATVLDQAKDDKVLIFKKRQRKTYRRFGGHRQRLTVLRVTGITGPKA